MSRKNFFDEPNEKKDRHQKLAYNPFDYQREAFCALHCASCKEKMTSIHYDIDEKEDVGLPRWDKLIRQAISDHRKVCPGMDGEIKLSADMEKRLRDRRCSGLRFFPGGDKCPGCPDCIQARLDQIYGDVKPAPKPAEQVEIFLREKLVDKYSDLPGIDKNALSTPFRRGMWVINIDNGDLIQLNADEDLSKIVYSYLDGNRTWKPYI